jgi:hypothetical protein
MPFDPEAGGAFLYVLLVAAREIAFGKTEVIEGVEQVGLAHTVVATDADNSFSEPEGRLAVVLELKK